MANCRTLIVDDVEGFRRFMCVTLRERPECEVVGEVSDGLQAVQQAEQLQPDLILLEIGLPILNGIEAARRIRKLSPNSRIRSSDEVSTVVPPSPPTQRVCE